MSFPVRSGTISRFKFQGYPVGQATRSARLSSRSYWKGTMAAVGLWLGLTVAGVSPVEARESRPGDSEAAVVQLDTLPPEAQATERLIRAGGPFRHAKDGSVFGNRERLLPARPRGFYREYTVRTPGVRHRGARRIVCGGEPPTRPETCYYTDDHYASFRRIAQ